MATFLTRKQVEMLTGWDEATQREMVTLGKVRERDGSFFDPAELYCVSPEAREAVDQMMEVTDDEEFGVKWYRWLGLLYAGLIEVEERRVLLSEQGLLVARELQELMYACIIRAHRFAHWANHAWGLVPEDALAEVWNLSPSLKAFAELLPGYAIARGWIVKGPARYGVVGPAYEDGGLVVELGMDFDDRVVGRFRPGRSVVASRIARRSVEVQFDNRNGEIVTSGIGRARDWARVARLLIIAEQPSDAFEAAIREACWMMACEYDPERQAEFWDYFWRSGPEILAGE